MQKVSSSSDLNRASDIRFIRTVAAPKNKPQQIKTINHLPRNTTNNHNYFMIDLSLNSKFIDTYRFPYNQSTTVSMLITFLKYKLKKDNIYFQTTSFHLDYFLTLENCLISQLKISNLQVNALQILKSTNNTSIENMYSSNAQIKLSDIQIIKCIGCGGFSKVFLGRLYGLMLAVKVIDKKFIIETNKQTIIQNQRLILGICEGHPFITKLYAAFQTNNYVIFVMQYCNGGELFNLLRRVKKMKEQDAKFYFLETLAAIQFLHTKGILYRDLKPQNIMLDAEGHVRLADFGLSKVINNELTYSFCGSAEYMSPQMLLKKGHGYEVDYYCLGALLYELVTGLPPFYTTNQTQLFNNILNQEVTFPSHTKMSDELKQFLLKILEKDANKRYKNIREILENPWVKMKLRKQELYNRKMKPPYPTDIFIYNFDDGQFMHQEQIIMKNMQNQSKQKLNNAIFSNLYYQSKQIINLKNKLNQEQNSNMFLKKKQNMRANSITNSRQYVIKSRQNSINSINSKQSASKHYFPSRRQSTDNLMFNPHLLNAKSTPTLNRYLIKNQRDLTKLRKDSINNSNIMHNDSKQINTSMSSNFNKNIYTSKMGYYQNKNTNKVNNHYYFNRFLNNQIYQKNQKANNIIKQQLSSSILSSKYDSDINYHSLNKSKKKLSVSLSKSLKRNDLGLEKQIISNNYSRKNKGNEANLTKKYYENYKGKLNLSKIKKIGISVSDKSFFQNLNREKRK